MLVACLGDVMLDVIVETGAALVTDDDTPARDHLRGRRPGRQRRDLGAPPWAAGRGCSVPAPTPARATWSSAP